MSPMESHEYLNGDEEGRRIGIRERAGKIKLWILKTSKERQNRILDTTEDIIRNIRKYIIIQKAAKTRQGIYASD